MLVFKGLALALLQGQSVGPFPPTFQAVLRLHPGPIPDIGDAAHPTSLLIGIVLALLLVYAGCASARTREAAHGIEASRSRCSSSRKNRPARRVVRLFQLSARVLQGPAQRADHHGRADRALRLRHRRTTIGRRIYAIGGNAKAAQLSGIKTERLTFFTFVNMGVLAALAGLVFAARLNTATPKAGLGFELDVIAACFIGGASAYGRRRHRSAAP